MEWIYKRTTTWQAGHLRWMEEIRACFCSKEMKYEVNADKAVGKNPRRGCFVCLQDSSKVFTPASNRKPFHLRDYQPLGNF